jgi:hypothetical protein
MTATTPIPDRDAAIDDTRRMDPEEASTVGVPASGTTLAQNLLQLADAEARLEDAKRAVIAGEHAVSAAMRGELGAAPELRDDEPG